MPITIQLDIKGEPKIFVAPAPKARMIRNAIALTDNIDETKLNTADLDNLVNFAVEVFDKKFTVDDVYDGVNADKLMPTIMSVINGLVGGMTSNQAPNA